MPEIALRVVLTVEDDIALNIPATAKGGLADTGTATASIGDAMSLNFQTGIAEDTLLFGNIRRSQWADNQVKVPYVSSRIARRFLLLAMAILTVLELVEKLMMIYPYPSQVSMMEAQAAQFLN